MEPKHEQEKLNNKKSPIRARFDAKQLFRRKLVIVAVTMIVFSLVSAGIVAVAKKSGPVHTEEKERIVTSFYPVYIIAKNLGQGIDTIEISNLTENHTGCLHDYQMTTADMRELSGAKALIINGGDMELFVTEAVKKLDLPVIDASLGIELLKSENEHHHEHEKHEADKEHEADEEHESDVNGHMWLLISAYIQQVRNVADGLCQIDPDNAKQYRENEAAYLVQLENLQAKYEALKDKWQGQEVIVFHDAFYYLCEELGIEVIGGVDLDADTALSAGEIAEMTDEIKEHGVRYLFAEESTGAVAMRIAAETGCEVLYLNPMTSGKNEADAYLQAAEANRKRLDEAVIP